MEIGGIYKYALNFRKALNFHKVAYRLFLHKKQGAPGNRDAFVSHI